MRLAVAALLSFLLAGVAGANWKPEYAQLDPEVQRWFSSLQNKHHEFCCFNADGIRPSDDDVMWDSSEGRYRVQIDGVWTVVEDFAKLDEPNKVGRPIVWVRPDKTIRCFLPGSEG